jgi:hypothetical protein
MGEAMDTSDALMLMADQKLRELREERDRLRKALGAVAVDALQRNWEDVEEWAKSVRIEFPNGEPEVRL